MDHGRVTRVEPSTSPRGKWASEGIVLGVACLAPWAFGSVDAWAELALEASIAVLTILRAFVGRDASRGRRPICIPSLAIGGLALLGVAQTIPLPTAVLKAIAPGIAETRTRLVPDSPASVVGDTGAPIAPPLATLSLVPELSAHTAAQLAAAWLLFQCVLGLGGGYASLRRFGIAMVINCSLLALFSIAQALSWGGKIYGVRTTAIGNGWYTGGPFVCHNHLAAYLNLGLGFALGFLLARSRHGVDRQGRPAGIGRNLVYAYAAGLIVVGIVGSHSRGGFLAMVTAAVTTFAVLKLGTGRSRLALIAVLTMSLGFLAAMGSASPLARLGTIFEAGTTGLNGRAEVWEAAARAGHIDPLFGTGLGTFAAAATPYFERDHGVFFSHAENEYLQIFVEGGLLGLVLAGLCLFAIAKLGMAALAAAPTSRDRSAVTGSLFGCLALCVQSLGDFPLHIPGVSVAAVITSAHLCRLGLAARSTTRDAGEAPQRPRVLRAVAGAAMIGLGLLLVRHGITQAMAEASVAGAGLPLPGATMTDSGIERLDPAEAGRRRAALEAALRSRPDWFEGHLRLGMTLLSLYQGEAERWLAATTPDPKDVSSLADPLRLHAVVHSDRLGEPDAVRQALEFEPVRLYLVPAARSFLEARRCCPVSALAHARLGSLDYLLSPAETASAHSERALRLAGFDGRVADLAARVAAQVGDLDLAARCWRRAFEIGVADSDWLGVARAVASALSSGQILEQVLSDSGKDSLRFACRIYTGPGNKTVRDQFLAAALERLARDTLLPAADRFWFEGQAEAWSGHPDVARDRMGKALALDAARGEWRAEYVYWLMSWGDLAEAHRQARIGAAIDPRGKVTRRALKSAVDSLARFGPSL
jgi:O-antigen ligase/tetratricopeptide (TPR) repeat protein